MKILASKKIWTDEKLMALQPAEYKHELWFGEIITMPPAGAEHGKVIMRLAIAMGAHIYENNLGEIFDGQTGFRLSLDLCFAPDISFVSKTRLKLILPVKEKLFHGAPDVAVEVLSPSDSITKTEEKIKLYLTHGTQLAWMVDIKHQSVRAYRKPDKFELLRSGRFISGNSVLPGFRFGISKLFGE